MSNACSRNCRRNVSEARAAAARSESGDAGAESVSTKSPDRTSARTDAVSAPTATLVGRMRSVRYPLRIPILSSASEAA